jgi:hypothetical protein
VNKQDRKRITDGLEQQLEDIEAEIESSRDRKGKIVRSRGRIKERLIRWTGAAVLLMRVFGDDEELLQSLGPLLERWRALRNQMYEGAPI